MLLSVLKQRILAAAVCILACTTGSSLLASACPEATGWYYSEVTNMCYRGLSTLDLTFSEAQKRCNSLRSNLFQFKPGDTKDQFDQLQTDLYNYRNTSEFRYASWIGLTDRAKVGQYFYLNKFPLDSIAPRTVISCPTQVPNCKPAYRCVYLNLDLRGTSNRQVFNGDCNARMPAICCAPPGGTDTFDPIPELGASSVSVSGGLLLACCLLAANFWQSTARAALA